MTEKGTMSISDVAGIFNALKTENRIRALEFISEGDNLSEIAEQLDMSHSGVHSYLEDMEEMGLVEHRGTTREITQAGKTVLEMIDDLDERLKTAKINMLGETAKEMGFASPINEEELRQILEQKQEDE